MHTGYATYATAARVFHVKHCAARRVPCGAYAVQTKFTLAVRPHRLAQPTRDRVVWRVVPTDVTTLWNSSQIALATPFTLASFDAGPPR